MNCLPFVHKYKILYTGFAVNYGHFCNACHLYTNIKFYTLGLLLSMGIFALLAICTYTDIKFYEFYTQAVLLTMGIFALLAKSCFVAMAAPADGKLCL